MTEDPSSEETEPDRGDGAEAAGSVSEFWADEAAGRVVENDRSPVVKGGVSPSGIPHIGNFNELARGYYVRRALERRAEEDSAAFSAEEVRQVFTSDDRDPLRSVPSHVVDTEGRIQELPEDRRRELEEHLGRPYVDVPAPFDTAGSWADHFKNALKDDAEALGLDVEFHSNDELYREGAFDEAIRLALDNLDVSRRVIQRHQRTAGSDYVPFMVKCESCGCITADVTDFTLTSVEPGEVSYHCTATDLGGREIEGCGHEGTTSLRDGKLPWRFEWPAQWMILDVGFEPFGKDHAEGSWESGVEIAEEVYGIQPPEPMVYEFFLVDGEKMSASEGNVYTVNGLLEHVEPEVLLHFFAKNPRKQRDFTPSEIHHLVNEFDRVEDVRRGDEEPADPEERQTAERVYPDVAEAAAVGGRSPLSPEDLDVDDPPRRPPYTFAAMVGVAEDEDARVDALRRSNHLPEDARDVDRRASLHRVSVARRWARDWENQYDVRVQDTKPEVSFDDATKAAFGDLADVVEAGGSAEEIQNEVFEAARRHDLDVGGFFGDGYTLFLGEDSGPKLGPLLAALDREFVVERLRET